LQKVLDAAAEEETLDHIYLHVQTSNDAAIAFYAQFGFENVGKIKNYYNRIEPPDCYILRKSLSGAECEVPETSGSHDSEHVDEAAEEKASEEKASEEVAPTDDTHPQ